MIAAEIRSPGKRTPKVEIHEAIENRFTIDGRRSGTGFVRTRKEIKATGGIPPTDQQLRRRPDNLHAPTVRNVRARVYSGTHSVLPVVVPDAFELSGIVGGAGIFGGAVQVLLLLRLLLLLSLGVFKLLRAVLLLVVGHPDSLYVDLQNTILTLTPKQLQNVKTKLYNNIK